MKTKPKPKPLEPQMNTDKHRYLFGRILLAGTLVVLSCAAFVRSQGTASSNSGSLPEVIEAIEQARVTTRILYVTAHPDDEPGAVLSYLARGLHADVALLSLTRGEGGQNALGPEQAPQLGVLRTEELMNATRVYGTRLFFTRAPDFGYSKTADETMKIWGDQVLEDMVRVIRTFRPHVIINNWGGVRGGHGQHVASGLLTPQAYAMAADAKAFPKLSEEGLEPWKAEALLQLSRGTAPAEGFSIPVSEISPLWGKSWGEIGVEGYLNHRTQGVGGVRSSPFFRRAITLVAVEGAKPDAELLAAHLTALRTRFPEFAGVFGSRLEATARAIEEAKAAALQLRWADATQALAQAGLETNRMLAELNVRPFQEVRKAYKDLSDTRDRIDEALAAVCGIKVEAQADRSEQVTGESFTLRVSVRYRTDLPIHVGEPEVVLPGSVGGVKGEKEASGAYKFVVPVELTEKDVTGGSDEKPLIYPFFEDLLYGGAVYTEVGKYVFKTEVTASSTRVTSTRADVYSLRLVPAVTLTLEPKDLVVASSVARGVNGSGGNVAGTESKIENRKPKIGKERTAGAQPVRQAQGRQAAPLQSGDNGEREIVVRVRHYATAAEKITVGIEAPAGWPVSANGGTGEQSDEKTKLENRNSKIGEGAQPVRQAQGRQAATQEGGSKLPHSKVVEFAGAGDQLVRFTVKPPVKIAGGQYELKAWAKRADGEEFRTSLEPLPTLPARMWSEPAVARVHVMDVAVPKDLRVGYVTAENDQIPQALREIGVHVELLDEAALAFGDLSKYDAIAIGIRAYELRSDLARANQRLLDYAAAGGALVVQYQREGVWNAQKPAPYLATASGQRTTDENSPVRFVDAAHPLLNFPNAIRAEDFSGWVQERGLYYWSTFDAKYTPVLAMKDPGEQEMLGALVTARHGKGVYIYTGLSFFRQLPEGVPGAYRLFVNLLSQGRRKME